MYALGRETCLSSRDDGAVPCNVNAAFDKCQEMEQSGRFWLEKVDLKVTRARVWGGSRVGSTSIGIQGAFRQTRNVQPSESSWRRDCGQRAWGEDWMSRKVVVGSEGEGATAGHHRTSKVHGNCRCTHQDRPASNAGPILSFPLSTPAFDTEGDAFELCVPIT